MMDLERLTLEMPQGLERWIQRQIDDGRFVDAGDYLRQLVRRDLESAEREGRRFFYSDVDFRPENEA